jgi:Flp pilus assembly protein CpaB
MARDETPSTLQRLRRKPSKRSSAKIGLVAVLILGIGLVLFDIAASGSNQVLIATSQILPGDKLDQSNTRAVSADLDVQADLYLRGIGGQSVARDAISEGEFIAKSEVVSQNAALLKSIAIEIKRPISTAIRAGDKVDVYCTKSLNAGSVGEPELTVSSAWVRKITQDSALGQSTAVVELLFSEEFLPGLLTSISREDDIALVNVLAGG